MINVCLMRVPCRLQLIRFARGCVLATLVIGAGASGCNKSSSSVSWTAKDLGPGRCVALNNHAQVIGYDDSGSSFVVSQGTAETNLGTAPDGSIAVGLAIADNGDVVGYIEDNTGRHAAQYSAGTWSPIAGLDGTWSVASSIGPNHEIVGMAGMGMTGALQSFLLQGGKPASLALPADQSSAAYVAGASGHIIGILETPDSVTHAFSITGSQMKDLGTLGGENSTPYAVNSRGDVVGAAETSSGEGHAFFSPQGGALVDLGLPAGAVSSDARGIDEHGRIAGNVDYGKGDTRPVVFKVGQPPVDLMPVDDAKTPFVSAHISAMSADGHIVGWGVPANGDQNPIHCILWSPGG